MKLHYQNERRAAQFARKILEPLGPTYLKSLVAEMMEYPKEYHQLYAAINPRHCELRKQHEEVEKQIDEALPKKLLDKYIDLSIDLDAIKETAWFHLGFAAAVRLLEPRPSMEVIDGGNVEPKLRGKSNL